LKTLNSIDEIILDDFNFKYEIAENGKIAIEN
jgi:hypothetical protein